MIMDLFKPRTMLSNTTVMDEDPQLTDTGDEPESEPETLAHPQPAWVARAAAAIPVLICFLGTGQSPWTYGVAAALIGTLALVFPPKGRVPLALLVLGGLVIGFTLLPMVPLPWRHWPFWRSALQEDFQIALPSTWSLQPQVTFEVWSGELLIGLWLFWAAFRPWTVEDRTAAIRILAGGFTALAVTSICFHAAGWKPASWTPGKHDFGPYANRNHFSCLMAMAALLCLAAAYELQRRKNRLWIVYAMGVVPAFAVILLSTSRAGLVLFFVGVVLWFATSSMRSGTMKRLAVGGSMILACTAAAVLFGQLILHRFRAEGMGVTETLLSDSRIEVYSEAARLFISQPVLGIGLGNFTAVFGMTHHLANGYLRYRHPESDWLWFLCEAGWPATTAMLMGTCLFVGWMGPWKSSSRKRGRRDRRLRTAAGLAFLISVGHGIVDTPNHGLPHLLVVCLLGALALRPQSFERARGVAMPWLFRVGGTAALLASGLWFATGLGMATPFGYSRSQQDIVQVRTLLLDGQAIPALQLINRAITAAPGSYQAYFLRAQITLKLGRPDSEAMTDFGRARYLEPHLGQMCMDEADTWLDYNPENAIPAWREALRREPAEETSRYRIMLELLGTYPQLRPAVRDLATKPSLIVIYLSTTTGGDFNDTLQQLLQRFPSLEGLTSYERALLANAWRRAGDRKQLRAFLAAHPALDKDTWQVKIYELAESGDMEGAFQLLKRYVHPPWNVTTDDAATLQQLDREFQIYPSDAKRGFYLYAAQRNRGMWDAALATLMKIAALPSRPRHVYFEIASVFAQKGDYPKAWQFAQQYLTTPD